MTRPFYLSLENLKIYTHLPDFISQDCTQTVFKRVNTSTDVRLWRNYKDGPRTEWMKKVVIAVDP